MIRPLTIATFLMACGSGLYLYQSKHEVQLLDRTIERAVGETSALREQSRLLAVEWTMLNDPERLRRFSNAYLHLQSIEPKQFTSLVELDGRLPAPREEAPPHGSTEQEPLPIALETGALQEPDGADAAGLPVPPIPAVRPVATAGHPVADPRVADTRMPALRSSVADNPNRPAAVADARVNDTRVVDQRAASRVAENRPEVRPPPALPRPIAFAPPRPTAPATPRSIPLIAQLYAQPGHIPSPTPVMAPAAVAPVLAPSVLAHAVTAPAPIPVFAPPHAAEPVAARYAGSLLGMARGTTPAAPRPTPVNASYDAN